MHFMMPFGFLIPFVLVFIVVRLASRRVQGSARRGVQGEGRPGVGWRRPLDALRAPRGQNLEARVLRAAYKQRGRLTVSDVVIETGLSIKEAEELINGMVDGLRVRMEVDERGRVIYEFPEIIERLQDG